MNVPVNQLSQIDLIRSEATQLCAKVKVLPDHIFTDPQPPYPSVVRPALVDSFFVSVRTLLEFLLVHKSGRRTDFTADTTLRGWKPQLTPAQQTDLNKHWEAVSKHLVHFSALRANRLEANKALVEALAADVLAVWDQFATASRHPLVPLAADNHTYDAPAVGSTT